MVLHKKFIVLIVMILSLKFGYAQCAKTKLIRDFIIKSNNYNAVNFKVKKTVVSINSFDLQKKRDTSITYETYWCIREKNKIQYLKENSVKGFTLSYNDTLVVSFTEKYAFKNKLDFAKQSEFEEAFYFLGKNNDTFFCNSNDSIVSLNDSTFNMFSSFESEAGPGKIQFEFTFDHNGYLIRKESFYNIEFAIPKIYTKVEYSNCKYFDKIPIEFISNFKSKHKQAISLIKTPKKVFKDSTTYTISMQPFKNFKFRKIENNGKEFNIDSAIKENKITLVYFWFRGCLPCAKLKPELSAIYNTFKTQGLQIIGLNDVDNKSIVDSTKSDYQNFFDKSRNVLMFNEGYPQIIVLNSKGEMLGRLNGYSKVGVIELKNHISKLLN